MDGVLLDMGNPFLKVIKQGSWISGEKYRNPLTNLLDPSDHDARLFISLDDVPPERAREVWKAYQGRLRKKIFAMAQNAGYSSDEIQLLLKSVNFYPPAQLLKGIEQNEEAIARFLKMGNYPNLLEVGEEAAEGLYTTPTKFIRQGYETGTRVQVAELAADEGSDAYRVVHKATAEAEHTAEAVGEANLKGYVQSAEYSLNEAQKALNEGKLDTAKKNLQRAKDRLKSARKLGGVSAEGGAVKELDALESQVDDAIKLVFESADDAKAMLGKTKQLANKLGGEVMKKTTVDLAALEAMGLKSSVKQRAFLKGVLEGEGKWATLRVNLEEASGSALTTLRSGARLAYKNWFMSLIALWELKEFPAAIEKEGAAKASARLAATIAGLANPTFGYAQLFSVIFMTTGELLVDWVSSYGYGAVVGRQDCMDLIAGIYTVPGREQNIEGKECEQIQSDGQLACRIYDSKGLRRDLAAGRKFNQELIPPFMISLLNCHAKAASKHYDDYESSHDEGVQQALVNKCLQPVLKTWLDSRQLVVNEVDALRQSMEEQSVRVTAAPSRLKEKGTVRLSADDSSSIAGIERDIEERAKCLGGVHAKPRSGRDYVWTVNGREFRKDYNRSTTDLSLDTPGSYEVCAAVTYTWRIDGLPIVSLEDGLSGTGVRKGCAMVVVELPSDDKKPEDVNKPETPPPADPLTGVKKEPPADVKKTAPTCSYEYSAWGECSRATKKQTRTVTAKKPEDCVERSKPSLEQGCTPPPTKSELDSRYYNCLCRCYCGWAGHIGVWWDPEGKSVPECDSSGPCFGGAGAFGCTRRHGFGAPNDCAKGCWEGAYGKGTWDQKKADEMRREENKKHKKPLKVKLNASKNPADFGDIVILTAEASDGTAGYKYTWGGCAQDAKDNNAKVLNSMQCKPCTASVTVTDQDDESASASVTIQCTALKVKLTKESPKENSVPIGGTATFRAEVFSGDKPASGSFTYLWERNPDVLFGDPKNPKYETTGGSTARNSASFRKPETAPVWVVVLREVEGRKMTVGESEQIMIQVVKPKLSLKAEPQDPLVGQEVKITLTEEPKLDDQTVSYWWEVAGNTQNAGPATKDQKTYTYKPKDDKPVTVTVHAKAKDGGAEIGLEKITVSAKKPTVTVTGPKIAGPPPMIWKEGVGLVPADRQIAEHQRVEFSVAVTPAGAQQLRYQWTVAPEGCSISAPSSKDTGVTCSKTGSYTMTCSVKSADGADFGKGTGSLSVTISQSDMATGKKKDEAKKKLDSAKQMWSQKKYDEAVTAAEAAAQVDPKLAQPVLSQFSQELKKMGWDALNKADHTEAIKRLEQAVKLNPADADAKKKLEEAKKYASVWPRVEAKAKEFDSFMAQKKVWSAQKAMLEMQDILRGQSGGQSSTNPLWARVTADFNKGVAWYNDFSQKSNAEWTRLFKEQDWEKAEAHIKQVLTQELTPADRKHYEAALQTTNSMLGMKKESMQYYETAKANFAKGQPADANGLAAVAKELRNKAARFKEGDARRMQITELAAAMEKKQKGVNAKAYAQSFFNNGDQYYRSNNFEPAVKQYDEGLKAIRENGDVKDTDYAKYMKLREDAAQKDKRFKELYAYAAGLATTTKPLDEETIKKGIASAEEGLKIRPRNGDMEIHWNKLKWKLGELQRANAKKQDDQRKCEAKWTEGQALYNAGKHSEALAKFRENIVCAPGNAQREAYVRQLDDSLKKQAAAKQACLAVRQQGDAFVQQKQYAAAVTKYRESLKCQPDPKLEAYIRQLESEMKKQADAQANATRAKQLRTEGEQFQRQNKIPEAITKYKEYLRYAPNDTAMANHIKTLETKYAADQRNSQFAMQLRTEGEQFQRQNKIPEAITKYKEYLRYAPNDTAMVNHVRTLEAAYAGNKVGTGRVYTAKPVETSHGQVTASSWTGTWKSAAGPEGETINFVLTSSGNRINGTFSVAVPYKTSSGARQTETLGGPLEGTVSGNRAKGTFRESSDAKHSGTFDFVMASGGNQFSCTVRATDGGDSRTYTVQRTR